MTTPSKPASKKEFRLDLGAADKTDAVEDFLGGAKTIIPSATNTSGASAPAPVHPKDLDPWILKGVRLRKSQMRILQAESDKRQNRDTGRGNTSVLIREIVEAEIQRIMTSRR